MFDLEIIGLLNEYKSSSSDYEKNKIGNSISNLIAQYPQDYQNFIQKPELDEWAKNLLQQFEKKEEEEPSQNNASSTQNDFEIIKNIFYNWLTEYNANQKEPNEKCQNYIEQIINYYAPNKFEIIKKILEIKENQDYEDFKMHLQNYLRAYYAKKIINYMNSESYTKLNFLKKRRKKVILNAFLDDLGKYIFEPEKIKEALN